MTRTTLRQRIADRLDRITADADDQTRAHGLTVTAQSRYRRTYRDDRYTALAAARSVGCGHVPVCPAVPGSVLPGCVVPDAREQGRAA
jgi:hypothetical protein